MRGTRKNHGDGESLGFQAFFFLSILVGKAEDPHKAGAQQRSRELKESELNEMHWRKHGCWTFSRTGSERGRKVHMSLSRQPTALSYVRYQE